MKKYFLFFLVVSIFILPIFVGAQAIGIPCNGPDCGFDDLVVLAKNVIDFLILLSIPLAVIAFIWAGILLVTAAGNEGQISKAKGIFWSVLKGFLFVLCAWLIVYTITSALLKEGMFYNLLGVTSYYLS